MITAIHRSIAAKREMVEKDEKGFTLVELLVVVLIIGILTAIAVPVFIGQQNQAKDAAAKSDLGVAKVALVSYFTADPDAAQPAAADLEEFGYVQSDGVGQITIAAGASPTDFCIAAASDTGTTFNVTESTSVAEGACA